RTIVRGNALRQVGVQVFILLQWVPRTIVRGNSSGSRKPRPVPICFNGAADNRPRKLGRAARWPDGDLASMGPRTIVRGNLRELRFALRAQRVASMGPW